ncbi:MAG: hypothetical protein ACO36I_22910 [Candidatus Latescibacterota bacterium]
MNEEALKDKAIAYLKSHYSEDTVRMDVRNNSVKEGNGELHVDCTVRIAGRTSDWTKWFTFSNGEVTRMRWQMR